jgi:hypothetical protein
VGAERLAQFVQADAGTLTDQRIDLVDTRHWEPCLRPRNVVSSRSKGLGMAIAGSHPWGRRALIACYPIAANYSAQEVRALDGKRLCVAHRDEIITEAFLLAISFSREPGKSSRRCRADRRARSEPASRRIWWQRHTCSHALSLLASQEVDRMSVGRIS